MAFSSTLLLPPMYDIQRTLKGLSDKYKNNVTLNPVISNYNLPGAAPKSAVIGLMTTLSDQLLRLNILKMTVNAEKRQRTNMAVAFLVVTILFTLLALVLIIWFILMPLFKECGNHSRKLEVAYFGGLVVVIVIYVWILAILTFQKNKDIYNKVYKTDIFANEPIVKYIEDMLVIKPADMEKIKSSKPDAEILASGTNPLVGYFVHKNRNMNITYRVKDACLDRTSRFRFNEKSKYVLNDKSEKYGMLNDKNLHCVVTGPGDTRFADPFILDNKGEPAVNPVMLKKKLQSFDMYGQVSRLSEAVNYFKGFLLRENDARAKGLSDDLKKKISSKISDTLKMDFIILRGIRPYTSTMATMKLEPIAYSSLDTINYALGNEDTPVAGYVDEGGGVGYGYAFTKADLSLIVFGYTNDSASKSFILVKRSDVMLMLGSETPPSEDIRAKLFDQGGTLEKGSPIPNYAFCDGTIEEKGNWSGCQDNFVHRPLKASLNGPNVADLFKASMKMANMTPVKVYVYHIDATSLLQQAIATNAQMAMLEAKKYFVNVIVKTLSVVDPGNAYAIDTSAITVIQGHLRMHYGSNFANVSNVVTDILTEVPIEIERMAMGQNTLEENDYRNKYITYDRFHTKMKELSQSDFYNHFYRYCHEARASSVGLKRLYDQYNYVGEVHRKNTIIVDITFYFILIIGATEICRFIAGRWISAQDQVEALFAQTENKDITRAKDTKRRQIWANTFWVPMALGLMIYTLVVSLMFAWKEKSRHIHTYNNMILEKNGEGIVTNADQATNTLTDAMILDRQFVKVSSGVKDTGDPDDVYDEITKYAWVQDDIPVQLSESYDLMLVYSNIVDMVESFEKCNKLLRTNSTMPFPTTEIVMYVLMIIIVAIIAAIVYARLDPLQRFHNLKRYNIIRRRIELGNQVTTESYLLKCELENLNKQEVENVITLVTSFLIMMISILFATTIFNSTSGFADALYGSDLFKNSMCYEF